MIHKITFKSYTDSNQIITGFNSIGFCTKEFSKFISPDYNKGDNGSTYISSNGYFVTSKCFDSKMRKHRTFIEPNENAIDHHKGWYKANDLVMIKIDTHKMKAVIWNSTPPKGKINGRIDLDVDKEYEDYKGFYFKFDLPKDIPVAVLVELGFPQSIEIVDHDIQYIK